MLPPSGLLGLGRRAALPLPLRRRVALALTALGFLLSVGAAFGATALVFNQGWFKEVVNLGEPAPVISFLPIIAMGVLFGLAMDYQVFLVSRMREEYVHGNTDRFVEDGYIHSARVVAAAALIMFCVFGAFALGDDRQLKLFGLGLAIAVLVDATIVRMVLVPATMELLGDRNWWIPRWLDKIMPNIDVEGHDADIFADDPRDEELTPV